MIQSGILIFNNFVQTAFMSINFLQITSGAPVDPASTAKASSPMHLWDVLHLAVPS
jgi:hypothetical protein